MNAMKPASASNPWHWLAGLALALSVLPAHARVIDLTIGATTLDVGGGARPALAINGSVPGPTLRFKEGEALVINVTNTLDEATSIHWHGLILPFRQDGVPGISFDGIGPGTTHTYRFPAQQSGTYWYHSHSGLQEQSGVYGAIVIEPTGREPFRYDREHVVVLSDWHDTRPEKILSNLKKRADYYNYNQRTVADFLADARRGGLAGTVDDRLMWGGMRMTPTDIADVTGYTFLVNGKGPEQNWTGLFTPGERVRLRFINASAMTYFDVRIPGLELTVVQADGMNVQPVKVDEFRIAVAETYDVIVQPKEETAYSVVAEALDRSGFARGTLAPRQGMAGALPAHRPRPLLTMADMGMDHGGMAGMDHAGMAGVDHANMPGMDHSNMAGMDHSKTPGMDHSGMAGMDHSRMAEMDHSKMPGMDHSKMTGMDHSKMPGMDHSNMAGMDHSNMAGMEKRANDPFYAPGSGLRPVPADGGRFLSYQDLKAQKPLYAVRAPTREIELRLTGNMERYTWSIDGKKYSEAEPLRLRLGERVRFKFVNETMMAHPMHLHGMWLMLDTGAGKWNPVKHVVSVAPGTTLYTETEVDAAGEWAFHCHLMYHMAAGMFRKVVVEGDATTAQLTAGE
jgi:CopA family copper-resistance protein